MLFLSVHFDSDLGMNFLRENWDTGFIVIVMGLIFGWVIYVTILGPFMP